MVTIDEPRRTTMTVEAGQAQQESLQIKEIKPDRELEGQVGWVRRVGDYFLVEKRLFSGSEINVLSMTGEVVRNLRKNTIDVNLRDELEKRCAGYSYIAGLKRPNVDSSTIKLQDIQPPLLRELILKSNQHMAGSSEMGIRSAQQVEVKLTNSFPSQEICGGKYLVDPDNNNLFAVQIKNDNGAPLPQDQWIIYTLATLDRPLPEDLQKWLAEKKSGERNISISASLDAVVSAEGLTIYKSGNRDSVLLTEPTISDPKGNFVVTRNDPPILYFIPSDQPQAVKRIVLDTDPSKCVVSTAPFPSSNRYQEVKELCIDPTESFFVFRSKKDVVIVAIDTLEQVGTIPDCRTPTFDSAGKLSTIESPAISTREGRYRLKFFDINFAVFAQKRQAAQHQRIAQRLAVGDIFMTPDQRFAAEAAQKAEQLQPIIQQVLPAFQKEAASIIQSKDLEGIDRLESALEGLRQRLATEMVGKPADVTAVIDVVRLQVLEPLKRELFRAEATTLIAGVQSEIQKSLSLSAIHFLEDDCRKLESMAPFLEDQQRQQVVQLSRELQRKTSEYMSLHGEEFTRDAENIVKNATKKLESFTSKAEMDDWLEYDMPPLLSSLGMLLRTCPPEAVAASAAIMKARQDLTALASQFEMRFKHEYAQVRERAAGRTEEMARIIVEDAQRFLERVRDKKFSTRKEAEAYVQSSQNYQQILDDIAALKQKDPDKAKAAYQQFEVKLSNLFYAIDRTAGKTVADTGQQIVFFGETQFPVWEGKVKQLGERKVDIVFLEDSATHGPGVSPDKIFGDIAVRIVDGEGKETTVRLFQEIQDEDDYRYGFKEKHGEPLPPSYITGEQYRTFKRNSADWAKGSERSLVQREYRARITKIRDLFATRPMRSEYPTAEEWAAARSAWKETTRSEYEQLVKQYTEYCQQFNIALLRRIDQIKKQPDVQHINGKGYVPEWQSHWVADPQTEETLENMAQALSMQAELQEGMLLLKGHAGTGKDVLVKMFCAETHRPYFAMDCTKWTTEYELSEDVALESENGASQTIKIPSVVLNAITTPGAVLYFNELNAMPEQAQIFLHSLLDEKRSLTLKTSSGKTIKAHPSLLIIGSMNQGYPGTFAPQFATRSRTVSIDVTYPPFLREPDKDDPNQKEKPINVSEALRIARGVTSLQEITYEMDLSRNGFVKLWENYINGIETGAPTPTPEQKFDIDVILALMTFGNELREHFIATFESQKKTRSGAKPLEVRQPLTGREMRRCAYTLSKMSTSEKASKNADDVARQLLARYFLTHLDDTEARTKIELHLKTLFSKKRLAAP